MGRAWSKTVALVTQVSHWCAFVGACLIGAIMLVIVVDVTCRYVFNRPIQGTVEMVGLLLVGVIFFPLAYTMLLGGHIRVELVISRLSARSQAITDTITFFVALVMLALFTYATLDRAIWSWQIREYWFGHVEWPVYPGRTIMPFGVFVLWMATLIHWVRTIGVLRGRRPAEAITHVPTVEEVV